MHSAKEKRSSPVGKGQEIVIFRVRLNLAGDGGNYFGCIDPPGFNYISCGFLSYHLHVFIVAVIIYLLISISSDERVLLFLTSKTSRDTNSAGVRACVVLRGDCYVCEQWPNP